MSEAGQKGGVTSPALLGDAALGQVDRVIPTVVSQSKFASLVSHAGRHINKLTYKKMPSQ